MPLTSGLQVRTRSETKTVRPFSGLARAVELLDGVKLTANEWQCTPAPDAQAMSTADLNSARLAIHFDFDLDALREAADHARVPYVDTSIVVIARATTLRLSRVIFQHLLSRDDLPKTYEIDRSSDPLIFGDRNGFDIRVALVITGANLQPELLKPSLRGTWLAKQDFWLRSEQIYSSFSLTPLHPEDRATLGLPAGCLSYIDVDDDSLLSADSIADCVVHYVDHEVLGFIQINESDPWSIQLQAQYAVDLISAICAAAHRALAGESGYTISESSLDAAPGLGRFIRSVARDAGIPANEFLQLAGDDFPRFRTHVEALESLTAATTRALRED